MKKVMLGILAIIAIFGMVGCTGKDKISADAKKFKKEYESINGKANASGLLHRDVSIDKKNPYVYTTAEEIVEKIKNKESFFLYVGDKQCPWCRSVIEKSIEVANEYDIGKIYYINIWDDDHNEILRDVYELDSKNKPVIKSKGTDAYYELLEYFAPVLRDYTLKDSKGKEIQTGEKRIYAPNYFFVKNGEVQLMVSGKSELLTDSRGELTKEILADQQKQFESIFSLASTCDDNC